MKEKPLVYSLLLFAAFYSLKPWVFHYTDLRLGLLVGPIVLILLVSCKTLFNLKKGFVPFSILVLLTRLNESSNFSIMEFALLLIITSGILAIFALKSQYKLELLELFDKAMLFIVTPGVILWMLFLMGFPLPHETHSWDVGNHNQIIYENYYFFITTIGYSSILPRFQSVFYEPGFFSLILLFLITYRKFNFKNYRVVVYTIAIVMSFSLAGYLLFGLMWMLQSLSSKKKMVIHSVLVSGILIGSYYFFLNYNGGNNVVNNMIIARMEVEDGELVGYNRTKQNFEIAFDQFISEGGTQLITGKKNKLKTEDLVGSVDWTVYWYKNGIIGLGLVALTVFVAFFSCRRSKYALLNTVLLLIVFARGIGVMWMDAFWLVYLCGTYSLYRTDDKVANNKLIERPYAKQV